MRTKFETSRYNSFSEIQKYQKQSRRRLTESDRMYVIAKQNFCCVGEFCQGIKPFHDPKFPKKASLIEMDHIIEIYHTQESIENNFTYDQYEQLIDESGKIDLNSIHNFQALCPTCHASKTKDERKKYYRRLRKHSENNGVKLCKDINLFRFHVTDDSSHVDETNKLSKYFRKKHEPSKYKYISNWKVKQKKRLNENIPKKIINKTNIFQQNYKLDNKRILWHIKKIEYSKRMHCPRTSRMENKRSTVRDVYNIVDKSAWKCRNPSKRNVTLPSKFPVSSLSLTAKNDLKRINSRHMGMLKETG